MAEASQSPKSSQDNSVSSTDSNGDTVILEPKNTNSSNIMIQLTTPRSSPTRSFRLRASLLQDSPGKNVNKFVLNPPKLSNPFGSIKSDDDNAVAAEKEDDKREEIEPNPDEEPDETAKKADDTAAKKPEETAKKETVSFVPLKGEPATPSSGAAVQPFSQSSSPALGFIFGQNIHEKVESAAQGESSTSVTEPVGAAHTSDGAKTNGATSEMLFSSNVKKDNIEKPTDNSGKTLSEAAREYEESRAVKRKFEEVQVVTGEEEEANVIQINCKLFSWSEYSWVERGRGMLRVNDVPGTNPPLYRLIIRTVGSLRVVLNTKVWSGMSVDKASNKSLRITAMDCQGVVKVFLILASPKDIEQLERCLYWRVENLKELELTETKKLKSDS